MPVNTLIVSADDAARLAPGALVEIRVKGAIVGHESLGEVVALKVSGETEVLHQTMRDAFMGAMSRLARPDPDGAGKSVMPSPG